MLISPKISEADLPKLSKKHLADLKAWLMEHNILFKNIHREFSNAVAMACLLKKFYPRLVFLPNYLKCSSTSLKISNWETLNYNVLRKIGVQLHQTEIEMIAAAKPGAIELLLYSIMLRNRRKPRDPKKELKKVKNATVVTLEPQSQSAFVCKRSHRKLISYKAYEKVLRESKQQEERICWAKESIKRLKNIIRINEEHTQLLQEQLSRMGSPPKKEKSAVKSAATKQRILELAS